MYIRSLFRLIGGRVQDLIRVPPTVLNHSTPIFVFRLNLLYRCLLAAVIFPSTCYLQSFVVPIFKSGNRGSIRNYHPIVIQSALAKIFKNVVPDKMYSQLKILYLPQAVWMPERLHYYYKPDGASRIHYK